MIVKIIPTLLCAGVMMAYAAPKKILLLGGGELGKEVVVELKKYGAQVAVMDRYEPAPAMHVVDYAFVGNMLDRAVVQNIVDQFQPDIIVPEIEAINTNLLLDLEEHGTTIIPSARATALTMNREGIRTLAAEQLGLPTSHYRFASTREAFDMAIKEIGLPCVVKPNMSSSGKGQTIIRNEEDIDTAWEYAQTGGRTNAINVIIEEFIPFDFEITLLTARDAQGETHFCAPIGHKQINGDYRVSWQPEERLSDMLLAKAEHIARTITEALGGRGIFGVELFIKGDEIYFSEVSPRPHDTGLVTLLSQNSSEFALHARIILGMPIGAIVQQGPSASVALLVKGKSNNVGFGNLENALSEEHTEVVLFNKPTVDGERRFGVALAQGETIAQAIQKALHVMETVTVTGAEMVPVTDFKTVPVE